MSAFFDSGERGGHCVFADNESPGYTYIGNGVRDLITVRVDENEPIERALKRFKKECQKSGVLTEFRRREYYEKPSVKRKRAQEAAVRKYRRRMQKIQSKLEMM